MTAKRMYGPYNQLIFDKLFSLYESLSLLWKINDFKFKAYNCLSYVSYFIEVE